MSTVDEEPLPESSSIVCLAYILLEMGKGPKVLVGRGKEEYNPGQLVFSMPSSWS